MKERRSLLVSWTLKEYYELCDHKLDNFDEIDLTLGDTYCTNSHRRDNVNTPIVTKKK